MSAENRCGGGGGCAITAIVLTKNEEVNITDCLAALSWVDDVIIVDSGSADNTLAFARRSRPDVRIFEHAFEDFGAQRNWALDNADPTHEWILFVDADERCLGRCAEAIRKAVHNPSGNVGFFLCYRNLFMGQWIKRCTMYPSWQLRLLKRGEIRFLKDGHGQREVASGPLGYIREPYDHYGFSKGIDEWMGRHNRYASDEAVNIQELLRQPLRLGEILCADSVRRRRALKRLAARLPLRPVLKFLYVYLLLGGFLDGKAGLIFCLLNMAHRINIEAKLAERKWLNKTGGESIRPHANRGWRYGGL